MIRAIVRSSAFLVLVIMASHCEAFAGIVNVISEARCEKTSTTPIPVFTWHPSSPDFYEACGMLKTTIFTIVIGPDGGVKKLDIERGTGCELADKEIARCIRTWCYEPAYRDGKPASVEYSVVINWGYPDSQSVQEAETKNFCRRAEQLWAEKVTRGSVCAPLFRRAIQKGHLPETK